MKKNLWRKAVSFGLCAAMAVTLGACGKSGGGSGAGKAGDPNLAKQGVYTAMDIEAGDMGDNADVLNMSYANGRIYVMLNIYDWSGEQPRNENKMLSFLPDGTDVQSVQLENPELGPNDNIWINNMVFAESGSIYAMRSLNTMDETDPENPIYTSKEELVCWDTEGKQKWLKPLEEIRGEEENFYVNGIFASKEGGVIMMTGGDKPQLVTFDGDGNIASQKPLSSGDLKNVGSMYQKADGTLLITSYNEDWSKQFIAEYDPATDTMGEKTELPSILNQYGISTGATTDFLLTASTGLYTYNLGDAEPKLLLSFVNSDLLADSMRSVAVIDEDHLAGAYSNMEDGSVKLSVFTRVDPKDIPDKQVLTLGYVSWLDSEARKRIADFNKNSGQYRITLRDYSVYRTPEDYQASYTKLNNDIISGDMPDILIGDSMMPADNYIAKGLIADIGSLIEKDEELSKVEFLENVFKAYSRNDKLYYVVPSFNVTTVIAKTSVVGDRVGWTMAEMRELMAQMPEGTQSFGDSTRKWFLSMVMNYCSSDFVNPSTGKCSFDTPEFIDVLEFAKTLPEEINRDYDDDYWVSYETQYRENRTLLMPLSIYSIGDLNYTINGQFGEAVTFIGFPKGSGNGSVINANQSFLLSSKSANLDGAWQFVRYYLTEEYQKELGWGMPVRKDLFMEKARQATEPRTYEDENGNQVKYEDSYMLNDGTEIKLEPMSQEQVDKIVSFIMSVEKSASFDQSILNIVEEEAAGFFSDQKSAQEVVEIIQSRAQIYVNENR